MPEVPGQLQQLMQGGGQPPPGAMPGPGGAPMQLPQSKEGMKAAALPKIHIGMQLLMSALPDLEPSSDESGVIYGVLQKLQKAFGKQEGRELVPAELQMLMQGQGGSPEQQAMMQGGPQGAQKPPGMPGM